LPHRQRIRLLLNDDVGKDRLHHHGGVAGKFARGLLAPVYGWFTEGFDTLDLTEAKALLEKLAAREVQKSLKTAWRLLGFEHRT
jgi:hypothetical protein